MIPAPGTVPAAVMALVSALLDVLTLAGVLHLDAATRTAVIAVLTSALALAGLLVPVFQHAAGMARLRARASR